MKDFGSVIWTLIVVGLGIYSMTAQARKKKNAAEQKHGHGEAWPSWAPESEGAEQEEAAETAPRQSYDSMQPEFEEGTDAEPAYADESRYSTAGYEAMASNVHDEGVHAPEASSVIEKAPKNLLSTPEQAILGAVENGPEELDFDLRKAVIYSEILKPKFEE